MINFSFIIPHRNSPDLLRRCLDSIPQRNDIEIIIIDDNSNANYLEANRFPGLNRLDAVCIFDKSGLGAGHARNIGLERAKGKWLIFADADDWFTSELTCLLDFYADDEKTDIVFFNYNKVDDFNRSCEMPISIYIKNFKNKRFCSEKVLRYSAWSPWSRMFKRSIQEENNIRFEELPFSNDMMFVLNMTKQASSISVYEKLIYNYYCPSTGSQTSVKFYSKEAIQLRYEGKLKLRRFYYSVDYKIISPLWRDVKALKIPVNKELKEKYNYSRYNDVIDTILYFGAKLLRIIQ